jgi:hypothetical protein
LTCGVIAFGYRGDRRRGLTPAAAARRSIIPYPRSSAFIRRQMLAFATARQNPKRHRRRQNQGFKGG